MNSQLFLEVNIQTLHANTVSNFPSRINSSAKLSLHEIKTMYGINNSLIVRCLVEGQEKDSYITIFYFSDVLKTTKSKKGVPIKTKSGVIYIKPITTQNNCKVRCQCQDFDWTFKTYNSRDNSLYGLKKQFVSLSGTGVERNPAKVSGLCKHLLATYREIKNMGIIKA